MLAERLTAQMLAGALASHPLAVTERLLAIQAQDPRGARLAIRARSTGVTAVDVDRALSEERSLLITWLNRGTLHLVRSEDYHWLHTLTTPALVTANARRLAQEGVSPDVAGRGVAVIERALAADGPLTRFELRDRLDLAGVPTRGQALVHLLMLATLRGLAVRGPMVGKQHAYVLVRDWLGVRPAVERDRALAELARRYLASHGPAGDRDLAKWAGVPLRDARAGLTAIASALRQRDDGLVALARQPPPAPLPPPRLLGAFDAALMGWTSREPIVGRHDRMIVSGGVFRPFAMVDGRAAGTWRVNERRVEIEPFGRMRREVREALDADARAVVAFFGAAA